MRFLLIAAGCIVLAALLAAAAWIADLPTPIDLILMVTAGLVVEAVLIAALLTRS